MNNDLNSIRDRTRELRTLLWACACLASSAGANDLLTLTPGGGLANNHSDHPSISKDGRFVAFETAASNLGVAGASGPFDILMLDRTTGLYVWINEPQGAVQPNANSLTTRINENGTHVVFVSFASNLLFTPGLFGVGKIYRKTLASGTLELVAAGNGNCDRPCVSANGRYVAFESDSSNLTTGDFNGQRDIFVADMVTGTKELLSRSTSGVAANLACTHASISADGNYVAFISRASSLSDTGTNGFDHVWVRDRMAGTTTLVSRTTAGLEANGNSREPSIWFDGTALRVFFECAASNLLGGGTNMNWDVVEREVLTSTTNVLTRKWDGTDATGDALALRVSADGRWVVFQDTDDDLVPPVDGVDTNGRPDVFLVERATGVVRRASVSSHGLQADAWGFDPDVASSATLGAPLVVFSSAASNLRTPPAVDTNGADDIYMFDAAEPAIGRFCFGDGSGTACPCMNSGHAEHGCQSSISVNGGLLVPSGSARVSADTLVLTGSDMPNATALYFQGSAAVASGLGATFGDGLRCAGGTIIRLGTESNVLGTSQYPGLGEQPVSVRGLLPIAGGTRTYQVWYRNAADFCTTDTFNLTNGVSIAWLP